MSNELLDIFMDRNPCIVELSEFIDALEKMIKYDGSDEAIQIKPLAEQLLVCVYQELGSQTHYLLNEFCEEDDGEDEDDDDEDSGDSAEES